MAGAKVSVVVPARNHWQLTQACIETLLAVTPADVLADVVLVDDGSTDGISAAWAAAQETFTPVLLPQNQGFSAACNAGASASRGELLLFLNNDAFVGPASVGAMRATFAEDPAIGVAGAKLLYADGTLQHAGLAMLDGLVSRWWHVHRQLPGTFADANVPRDLLAVTGAALMIRRSLFEALGGFDVGYTNGWEDVDLCLRAWGRGARVRYEPRAVIEHLESATLGRSHDDSMNERRFIDRWAMTLASGPRYPLAEIPPLALAVRRTHDTDERLACDHVRRYWGTHFGASVSLTRPGSRIDRAKVELGAALAKRRPTLEISWGQAALDPATGPVRVAFVAPLELAEANAYASAAAVAAWWTPTAASRDALIAAGAPAQRVVVVSLGAEAAAPAPRTGTLGVAARDVDAGLLREFAHRAPNVQTLVLDAGSLPEFNAIDIVLAARGGDRYGRLVQAALAQGCAVIASRPVDEFVAAMPGVRVVDDAALLATLIEVASDVTQLRAKSPTVQLAARRRLDPALAAQHAAQLARALVHGAPSSALVEMSPALAAHLCAAASEVSV